MFHSARIKLTAWYLTIILVIITIFSGVIYRSLSNEVDRFDRMQRQRMERRFIIEQHIPFPTPPTFGNPELVIEAKQRILYTLLIADLMLLAMSGILSYFLAGKTLTPIQAMLDEQRRFVSDASHELRTPLTSLKTTFEVYLRSKSSSAHEARTVIEESIEEVNKLDSLAESLLHLAHHENPREIPFTKVALEDVIRKAIKQMEPLAAKKKQSILHSLSDIRLEGNASQLTDLVVILLDNAVKYSPAGKPIKIITKKSHGSVGIEVIDKGIGITKSDLPHIFKRFYRADSARTKINNPGYGLGLAIAKSIAEAHHGRIEVHSIKGKGTTFTVTLPVKQYPSSPAQTR